MGDREQKVVVGVIAKRKEISHLMARTKLTVVRRAPESGEEHQVVVRPERNIDRLPAIWAPSNGRAKADAKAKVKTIDFDMDLNGKRVRAQLVILPGTMYVQPPKKKGSQAGKKKLAHVLLTTFDQRVFLVLIKIWEEDKKKDAHIFFSMREIARELGLDWGGETQRLIEESLYRLNLVTLDWQKSFITKNGKTIEIASADPTHILTELKIVKRKEDGKVVKEKGYFQFHSSIVDNLKAAYTRPVRLDVVCSFSSHVAQLIYTLIDREMYGNAEKVFQMRSENLFRVLGLTGQRYRYKSTRVEALDPALKELTGKPLSSGEVITSTALKETVDGKDFNAIIKKGAHKLALCAPTDNSQSPELTQEGSALIEKLMSFGVRKAEARDLVTNRREIVERELESFLHRALDGVENPAGLLVAAIRSGDYSQPAKVEAQREKQAAEKQAAEKQRLEEARESYGRRFFPQYLKRAMEELSRIERERPEAWADFSEFVRMEREKAERRQLSDLQIQEVIVYQADWFFNDGYWKKYRIPFLTFWEWDEKENPDRYEPK